MHRPGPGAADLLSFFLHYGVWGLFILTVADDSFLFLPVGCDLLTVLLVARDHSSFIPCVVAGSVGSAVGVAILDWVCRRGGEEGLKRIVKPRMHDYLKRQMEKRAALAIIITSIAPPPFPFGAGIAVASALQYPRIRLILLVFLTRVVRFALVGWAALRWGREIIAITNKPGFVWFMWIFIGGCVIGSVFEVMRWIRHARQSREVRDKIAAQ
jgi:membrane protein YqaA with SNARE-associated domain